GGAQQHQGGQGGGAGDEGEVGGLGLDDAAVEDGLDRDRHHHLAGRGEDGEQDGDPQALQGIRGEGEAAAHRVQRGLLGGRLGAEGGGARAGGGGGGHRSSSSVATAGCAPVSVGTSHSPSSPPDSSWRCRWVPWCSTASATVRARAAGTAIEGSGPSLGCGPDDSSRLWLMAASS